MGLEASDRLIHTSHLDVSKPSLGLESALLKNVATIQGVCKLTLKTSCAATKALL